MEATSHYFETNGLKLHYLSWGETTNHTIIMLHGIRSYANTWAPTAERLADNYNVIALDQRGRGKSDWSPAGDYFTDDYVSDLEALVHHLGLASFILLGHSLGGANSLVYSARHPDKVSALIIEDIGPGSSAGTAGAERIVREFTDTPAEFSGWDEARTFWRRIRPKISEQSLASRVTETLKEDSDGLIRWRFDFPGIKQARLAAARDTTRLPDLWPCVDSLQCPALVMRGSLSDFLSATTLREMAARNHRIRTAEIPNATHYVHDDNFRDFINTLQDFLNSLPG